MIGGLVQRVLSLTSDPKDDVNFDVWPKPQIGGHRVNGFDII